MKTIPLVSTFIALALIPIAILYVQAFCSGTTHKRKHTINGVIAVTGDLVLSFFYMLYRTLGGAVNGHVFHPKGLLLIFFILHGSIALVVVLLEVIFLYFGIRYFISRKLPFAHKYLTRILFPLWAITFFSGEAIYIAQFFL
jgi:hypothetical protein